MNCQNMLKYIKEGLLNVVFPLHCKVCGKPIRESMGYSVCEECLKTIKFIENPCCAKCGKPLNRTSFFSSHNNILCVNCKKHHYFFDYARSVGIYDSTLKKCIHLFKYYQEKKLTKPLGRFLVNYLSDNKELLQGIDLIIPVPLHNNDLKKRGFNQSYLLAVEVGNYFSIPVNKDLLIKNRITTSQVKLSKSERGKNLLKAFLVKKPKSLKNKNILLIDDVFTTGTTVTECSRELKKALARHVWVLTLARGMLDPLTVFP